MERKGENCVLLEKTDVLYILLFPNSREKKAPPPQKRAPAMFLVRTLFALDRLELLGLSGALCLGDVMTASFEI